MSNIAKIYEDLDAGRKECLIRFAEFLLSEQSLDFFRLEKGIDPPVKKLEIV